MIPEARRHWSWVPVECSRNEGKSIKFIKKLRTNMRDGEIRRTKIGAVEFRDHCQRFGGCPIECNMRKLAESDLDTIRSSFRDREIQK